MNKLPHISVLLPCYNAQQYLHEAVDSILNQTFSDFELILINDGSTDDSLTIINEYASQDDRVVAVNNEKNLGLIASLNKGIDLARGHWIGRMDADDVSDLKRFAKQVDYLKENPEIDLLGTNSRLIDEQGNYGKANLLKTRFPLSTAFISLITNPYIHGSILVKSEVIKELKYSSEPGVLHSEDFEMWSRVTLSGRKMTNLDEVLFYQRLHESNISRLNEGIQIENFIQCSLRACQAYYEDQYDPLSFRVTVNRINRDTTPSQLRSGIKRLGILKTSFIAKNKDISTNEWEEIEVFVKNQRIDILIQALLKGQYTTKISAVFLILSSLNVIFSSSGLRYLKSKI